MDFKEQQFVNINLQDLQSLPQKSTIHDTCDTCQKPSFTFIKMSLNKYLSQKFKLLDGEVKLAYKSISNCIYVI